MRSLIPEAESWVLQVGLWWVGSGSPGLPDVRGGREGGASGFSHLVFPFNKVRAGPAFLGLLGGDKERGGPEEPQIMLQPCSCLFRESSRFGGKSTWLNDGPQHWRLEGAASSSGEGTEEGEAQKGTLGMGAGGQAGT